MLRVRGRPVFWVLLIVLVGAVTACGAAFPADPDGTLDRIRSDRVLRAGATHHPPYVVHPAADADPTGTEVDLVTGYAAHLGATVEWTVGPEAVLVEQLGNGDLDLAVAGFDASSPWSADVGFTRPYAEHARPDGSTMKNVIATPAGENALLTDLERWLDRQEDR